MTIIKRNVGTDVRASPFNSHMLTISNLECQCQKKNLTFAMAKHKCISILVTNLLLHACKSC
eukprot:c23059_g1_i1 orf=134-319(-)